MKSSKKLLVASAITVATPPSPFMLNGASALNLEGEQGQTLDLLGIVAWNRDGLTPFVMFGYTIVELDSEITFTGTGFTLSTANVAVSDKAMSH